MRHITVFITALSLLFPILHCSAQEQGRWSQWTWLLGTWQGESDGKPGTGSGTFSLMPDLDGHVLLRKSHTEFPATDQRPAFTHDDLMVVTPATGSEPVRASYYDNEGHSILYMVALADSAIVMTSDAKEKSPFFRLTYINLGKDRIKVIFGMSMDGKEYRTYTEGICKRVKGP